MNPSARRGTPILALLAATLVAGCAAPAHPWAPQQQAIPGQAGQAPALAPAAAGQGPAALAQRDTAGIRVLKKEIKKHFEVVTLERIVTLTTLEIVPAPAWNEFVYEGTLVEDDLETGIYTFKVAGVYDAVGKHVDVRAKALIDFKGVDPRAPRGSDRGTAAQR